MKTESPVLKVKYLNTLKIEFQLMMLKNYKAFSYFTIKFFDKLFNPVALDPFIIK